MAHAYYHALSSARRFGGKMEDYLSIHEFMDHTKSHLADPRHRLLLHNAWGIFLAEKILGTTLLRVSDGRVVPLRPLLERHVMEDFGCIPSLDTCLADLPKTPLEGCEDDDMSHSWLSVQEFGGTAADYLSIHALLNATRDVVADQRHQRILHNAWGMTLLLRLTGPSLRRPSDGVEISVRPLLEAHIRHDLGHIPTLEEALVGVAIHPWMYREAQALSQYFHPAGRVAPIASEASSL